MEYLDIIKKSIEKRDITIDEQSQRLYFNYKGFEYHIEYSKSYYGYTNSIKFTSGISLPIISQYKKRQKIDLNETNFKLHKYNPEDVNIQGTWRAISKIKKRIEDFADFLHFKSKLVDEVTPIIQNYIQEDLKLTLDDIKLTVRHGFCARGTWNKRVYKKVIVLSELVASVNIKVENTVYQYNFSLLYPNKWWYDKKETKKIQLINKVVTYQLGLPIQNIIRYVRLKKIVNGE